MKTAVLRARLAVLSAAVCAASAAHGQASAALPETEVTSTRFAESATSLPAGVSVITAEDIRTSGASSVNEAIMRMLGVPGRQDFYGGGEYSLDLRGFGSTSDLNQVIVVDGVRLNEKDLGGTRLAGIPIDTVERIEVFRGSSAVLYGEGATGGAIVVTTKGHAGAVRRNSASVYAAAGSYGLRDVRASGAIVSGGLSLDVAGQKRDADNYRDNARSGVDNASFGARWTGDNVRLGVRHSRDALDARLPGSLTAAQYAANPRQTATPANWASIDNERTSVSGDVTLGDWQLAAEAGTRQKQLASASGYGYDIDARNYGLRARHETTWGALRNVVTFGADRDEWSRRDTFGGQGDQSSTALYLKDDLTLSGGTRLSAGWRTERIDKRYDSGFSVSGLDDRLHAWELGVSQSLTAATSAWARVGKSFRLATVDEFSYVNAGDVLAPQTSRDVEAGVRWSQAAVKLDARLYRSSLDNELGYDPAGNFGFGANVNYDPTRRQGLELDGSWAAASGLTLRANLAWREATFRSGPYAGNDVPLVPRRTVSLRADWIPAAGHRVTGGVTWAASQYARIENQCRMPSYATADVRYAYQWNNVELALGVSNLFDRDYYAMAFGCAGAAPTSIYPEAGRAVTASVRVSF
ncbi:MAG: TonB-dependent receptor [Burkholderiales bacterium]|nr:TonB-dependent receptor [Burkholderiales bacterium]